jgi:hypothetical protein
VRELVMVIADLFLGPHALESGVRGRAGWEAIPGIEAIARFGERLQLTHGWRSWVAGHLGRAELAGLARACVAGARLDAWQPPASGACWIATPVHLSAGLTRVHLHHAGLLRLTVAELGELAGAFARTLGGDGATLLPLPAGELLLSTPAIAPVPTSEPARLAGGLVSEVLPEGTPAAPLRRLMAECEMWLHGEALNRARRAADTVTALWPWGAAGTVARPARRVSESLPAGFGRDAWLDGLWHLSGGECRALPRTLAELLAGLRGGGALAVLRVAEELHHGGEDDVGAALARLDERFVSPALRGLAAGEFSAVTLLLNDRGMRVRRTSRLRLWRRRRAGLTGFA